MLKSYEVCNFKSFKKSTKFDLERTNYQTLSSTNVNGNILKGLMFVGANASGKSNSIMAIKFLLDCLFGKNDINMAMYLCMFSDDPVMKMSYTFEIEGTEIVYSFSYQKVDKSIKEDLSVDGINVFTRDGSVARVAINEESVHTDVPKDTLFIRDIYFNTKFRGHESLQKWFQYLSNSVYIDLYEKKVIQYRDIDLSLKTYMEQDGVTRTNSFFEEHNFEQTIEYDNRASGNIVSIEAPEKVIFFKRKGIDEPIPYGLESLGNRNLLHMLPAFFHCISQGGMLLLDEFSSGFHNDLEKLLIRYFMNTASEGQLIFVSHSTNLLSNSILRPDQIYTVSFDSNGSTLKRFSSEKPREAQNLEKMYLAGVFSGVPKYECSYK